MTKGGKIAIGIFGLGFTPQPSTTTTTTTQQQTTTTTGGKPADVDTLAFQKYVLEVKKDTNILGSYGADGQWGSRTQAAWDKYGSDYRTYLSSGTQTGTGTGTGTIDQEKKNYSDTWYEQQADKVYDALDGMPDDNDMIRQVFSKLKSNADYWALKAAFGKRDGYDMKAWMKDDMWQWEIDKYANKPMKANGVTVWIS
jgi:hypothetical protein